MMSERRFQGHVLAFDDAFRLLSSRGSERPAGAPVERPVASSAEDSSETGEPEVTSDQPTS